jgi:hypothetical protein
MACRTDSVSTQLHRLGDGKSGVAGEDTPELLRERSPIPEPSLHGCLSSLRRALLSQVRSSHLPDMGGDHGFLVGRDHPG